jgi:hypothetical protein
MAGAAWTLLLLHAAVVKMTKIEPASTKEALLTNAFVLSEFFTNIAILKVVVS